MVTCRPDILLVVIKLSQYSTKPAKVYYQVARHMLKYFRDTQDNGLHFWRPISREDLPNQPLPKIREDINDVSISQHEKSIVYGYIDADWGRDTNHRRSISGMA